MKLSANNSTLKVLFLFLLVIFASQISAAQSAAINTDGSSAAPSAALDIKSTTKGLLIPRMTSAQRLAIPAPAEALLVYQTDGIAGYYFQRAGLWVPLSPLGGASGTLNFLPKFTPDGLSLGNSQVFDNATSVGVGTSTPDSLNKLQVSQGDTSVNASGVTGVIESTSPGGFSSGVRGVNNGSGGLGIGVWGLHAGSGWGVYGSSPSGVGVNASGGTGIGVNGTATSGTGVQGSSSTGAAGQFNVSNGASTGDAVRAIQAGLGRGVFAAITNTSNIVAAVRGETDGGGYGVFGRATGNGNAGFFQISNAASTSSTVNVATNGIGSGVTVQLTNSSNGARGLDVLQAGVGPGVFATSAGGNAVWGITSAISAAGTIGDNTYGEAVVGRNRGGFFNGNWSSGVGAVVGRNDGAGYGVRGFVTQGAVNDINNPMPASSEAIGVLGQAGISGGSGNGVVAENVNATNNRPTLVSRGNGTGSGLLVNNNNAAATDLAVFQKSNVNVARIDSTGKGFFNNGTQVGGADVAEYFSVEGERESYEPGDVLVISQRTDRTIERSSTPYSTLVSGVYATKPGISLTERDAQADQLDDMVPMGVIGVIPTKVCLEGGTIRRGDLLVTSSKPGVAMKADLDKVKTGQVLGKALEDFNANTVGKIRVLVSVK